MNNETYEQYELTKEQVGDAWKFLKDGMECSLMVYNNNPLTVTPPNHVVLKVEYAEPAARGNTATNVQKPVKLETGRRDQAPGLRQHGRLSAHRHPHRRVHRAGQSARGMSGASICRGQDRCMPRRESRWRTP